MVRQDFNYILMRYSETVGKLKRKSATSFGHLDNMIKTVFDMECVRVNRINRDGKQGVQLNVIRFGVNYRETNFLINMANELKETVIHNEKQVKNRK